ncbi:MAG: glucosamine-6-phosphate deaminase [Clostridia bacterium]|nr:glucosamine-6-phosphate deaminase [Clostridia bacterium]
MTVDRLNVFVFDTRAQMGACAARDGAQAIKRVIARKGSANVMFAAAFSQKELLEGLIASDVDFTKVHAFHMDNYLGLAEDAPQQFSQFLTHYLFRHLPFASVNLMGCDEADAERYAQLLAQHPLDICFMGIGENGHIAFNDPAEADFCDPKTVKTVRLDEVCRMQQVHDGCFAALKDVPTHALTVTIPALLSAREIFCVVPAATKADAARRMLLGPVEEKCPCSILRTHEAACLYLDKESASKL